MLQNVRAQNFVGFSVGNELYHPFDIFVGNGTAISTKRKLPNSHLHPFFFRLIFGNADAGQLRVGVNDAWDRVVIYVAGFSGNDLNAGNAFIFGLVREHRAGNDVANGVDSFDIRPKMLVDLDPFSLIKFDPNFFCAETLAKRLAPNRHQHLVGFKR
jgi:hypothetical protein